VIPRFILWGQQGKPLQVHGDGTQSRDFTYIDNVVSANLLAARGDAARVSGHAYNVGCGSRTSLLEIITMLEKMLGRSLTRRHSPAGRGTSRTPGRRERGQARLRYEPLVDFDEGLRRTVEFFIGGSSDDACHHYHRDRRALRGRGCRPAVVSAQNPTSLVVQVPTEPPGLDMTSNPSSAIAAVVFDNVQEGLIKIDRTGKMVPWLPSGGTRATQELHVLPGKGVRFSNGREMRRPTSSSRWTGR